MESTQHKIYEIEESAIIDRPKEVSEEEEVKGGGNLLTHSLQRSSISMGTSLRKQGFRSSPSPKAASASKSAWERQQGASLTLIFQ